MKKIHLLISSLILALLIIGCDLKTQTLADFYEKDLADVSKIVIVDGNTGYEKTATDKETINSFLDEIKEIKFTPEENQEDRDGFNYSIRLFEDNEKTFQFGPTQVNETYYYTEPDIHPIVNDFYQLGDQYQKTPSDSRNSQSIKKQDKGEKSSDRADESIEPTDKKGDRNLKLVEYDNPVEHFFHPVIVYPELAFVRDSLAT